jgi:hypothetical protein
MSTSKNQIKNKKAKSTGDPISEPTEEPACYTQAPPLSPDPSPLRAAVAERSLHTRPVGGSYSPAWRHHQEDLPAGAATGSSSFMCSTGRSAPLAPGSVVVAAGGDLLVGAATGSISSARPVGRSTPSARQSTAAAGGDLPMGAATRSSSSARVPLADPLLDPPTPPHLHHGSIAPCPAPHTSDG